MTLCRLCGTNPPSATLILPDGTELRVCQVCGFDAARLRLWGVKP